MLKKAIIFFVALALLAPSAFAVTLTGDFDGDGVITLSDLTYFLLQFRHAKAGTSWDAAANVDGKPGLTHGDAVVMTDAYLRDATSTPLLALTSDRAGGSGSYDVYVYNRRTDSYVTTPGLNSSSTEYVASLSSDGRYIVFQSNGHGSIGSMDVFLYDLQSKAMVALPGLNSSTLDVAPSASANANYIVFCSDRAGGVGGDDIYLYDRTCADLVPLPGLNSADDDVSPAISANGRWIVFVPKVGVLPCG